MCMSSVELIEVLTVLWVQLRTCSKLSRMCDDMCDVLYDVMLYCNVVQSFVLERHKLVSGTATKLDSGKMSPNINACVNGCLTQHI